MDFKRQYCLVDSCLKCCLPVMQSHLTLYSYNYVFSYGCQNPTQVSTTPYGPPQLARNGRSWGWRGALFSHLMTCVLTIKKMEPCSLRFFFSSSLILKSVFTYLFFMLCPIRAALQHKNIYIAAAFQWFRLSQPKRTRERKGTTSNES